MCNCLYCQTPISGVTTAPRIAIRNVHGRPLNLSSSALHCCHAFVFVYLCICICICICVFVYICISGQDSNKECPRETPSGCFKSVLKQYKVQFTAAMHLYCVFVVMTVHWIALNLFSSIKAM